MKRFLASLLVPCLAGVPHPSQAAMTAPLSRSEPRSWFADQALTLPPAGERLPAVSSEAKLTLIAGAATAWFADRYEDMGDLLRSIFRRRFKAAPIAWEQTLLLEHLTDRHHAYSFLEQLINDPRYVEGMTKRRLLGLAQAGLNPAGPHRAGLREDMKPLFRSYGLDQRITPTELHATLAALTPSHEAADLRELTHHQEDIQLFDSHLQLVRRSQAPDAWKPYLPEEMGDPEYVVLVPREVRLAKRYTKENAEVPFAAQNPIAFLQLKRLGTRWVATGYDFPSYTFLTSASRKHVHSWASILLLALEDIALREGATELWIPAASFFENNFIAMRRRWIWGLAYSPLAEKSLSARFRRLYNTLPQWHGFQPSTNRRFPAYNGPERITYDVRQILRHPHFFVKHLGAADEPLKRFQQICLLQKTA